MSCVTGFEAHSDLFRRAFFLRQRREFVLAEKTGPGGFKIGDKSAAPIRAQEKHLRDGIGIPRLVMAVPILNGDDQIDRYVQSRFFPDLFGSVFCGD